MIFLAGIILVLIALRPRRAALMIGRMGIVAGFALLITSYFWLPFLRYQKYLQISPYLQRWKYDSYGAEKILAWLARGDLLDHGRLPVITFLLAIGIAAAIVRRRRADVMALVLFGVWLALYFGRVTWGSLADLLPMHEGLLFDRFNGAMEFAAIALVGVGGEWLWARFSRLEDPWRTIIPAALVAIILVPAFVERGRFYQQDGAWLRASRRALDDDRDLRAIVADLKTLPPGRVFAGLRTGWGANFTIGGLHVYDVLTSDGFDVVEPPYQALSQNADLMFHFDDQNPALYNLFDVKYVVAPPATKMASFLKPILATSHFVLYETATSGFGEIAKRVTSAAANSRAMLFDRNRAWMLGGAPAEGSFLAWSYQLGGTLERSRQVYPTDGGAGSISDDTVQPDLIRLRVDVPASATIVIKTTYFPKWQVTVDGKPARTFMASPSFIGVVVPAGIHDVQAEYYSGVLKIVLLIAGAIALIAACVIASRYRSVDAWLRRMSGA